MAEEYKSAALAGELTVAMVRLIRWLRAIDPAPAMTPAQASAMAVIIHSGGVTPSQLADHEQVRRPTISRLVEELEASGLVERSSDPQDRRSVLLRATDLGRRIWFEGQERRARPLAERIDALSEDDRAILARAASLLMEIPNLSI